MQERSRVIVIGAGVSGLATAYTLAKAGVEVLVLERATRIGGCVWTERTPDGYLIEHGPNSLLNLSAEVDRLCDELGLDSERVFQRPGSRRRYLVKNRTLVPVPSRVSQFPLTPLWSVRGKLRALAEPFIPRSPRPQIDESVGDFVRRRLGSEILDYAVEPFVAGIFAGDPEHLSMASSFPWVSALERKYGSVVSGLIRTRLGRRDARSNIRVFSFRKGVGQLPAALGESLGHRVLTGVQVEAVRSAPRDGAARFVVEATHGGRLQTFTSDRLVIATPADVAGRLLSALSPPLADQLEQIPYAPVGLVHLGLARSRLQRFPDGSGCLIPKREGLPILGSLWSSNVYPDRAPEGRVLLTNYVGGVRDCDVLKWSDEELVRLVLGALRQLFDLKGAPEFVRVLRHTRAVPQYLLGHAERVQAIDRFIERLPGLYVTGNYLRGVSVRDCLTQGVLLAKRVAEDVKALHDDEGVGFPTSRPITASPYFS